MPTKIPTRLYKYMQSAHLEKTLTDGTFRIGTLYEFRNIERFGDEVGDDGEGKKTVHLTATQPIKFDLSSDDPRAVHARKVFKGWDQFPPGSTIVISMEPNSSLELHEESPDMYIYCVTTKHSAVQMRAFGYDACLVINEPQGFFIELSNCLPNADFIIGAEVQYGKRRVDQALPGIAPGAFLKPSSYADQCEFRAIWKPHSQPITPLIINCPRALHYCARHELATSFG